MRWRIILFLFALILIAGIFSYEPPRYLIERRVSYAKKGVGDIIIGVNWPFSLLDDHFKEGLILAQEQINNSGGILGRKLVLDIRDNRGEIKDARKIARSFTKNKKIPAVIGHAFSDILVEVSVTYEDAGLILITPRAQLSTLSEHGLRLFFRTTPDNNYLGQKAAFFTSLKNYRHPIIIMESSEYSRDLANIYEIYLALQGISVVYTFYYFPWNSDYRGILNEMEHMIFDIVFIAMDGKEATDFVLKARALEMNEPIMCLNMTSEDMIRNSGVASDTIFNVVFYRQGNPNPIVQNFERDFKQRFNFTADNWAAKGYDSVKLLAYIIEKTKTTDPFQVAANLRYLKNWECVSGTYNFSTNGNVTVFPCYLEEITNKQVIYKSESDFPEPDLTDKLNRIFEIPIANNQIELTRKDGIVSVVLTEKLLFGNEISSIDFWGRLSLAGIAYLFKEMDSTTLHVLSHLQNSDVNLDEGIGDLLTADIEDLRSMTVGSYLIGQGVDSKLLYLEGADEADLFPDRFNPDPVKVTGNRMEIVFVPDTLFKRYAK